jgi:endonuclease YncB( thermonuclease family)
MARHLSFAALAHSRHGEIVLLAAVAFAVGLIVGTRAIPMLAAWFGAASAPISAPISAPMTTPATLETRNAPARTPALLQRFDPRLTYPAEVVRVIDGDTFEARVRVWPGLDVDTKVRLRGIDAPELHARCGREYAKAQAARAALETILAEGGVAISRVGLDKYAGRVDAITSTQNTADVSAALLSGGFARSYDGGRRGGWC